MKLSSACSFIFMQIKAIFIRMVSSHMETRKWAIPLLIFLCLRCFIFSDRTPPQVIITSKPASLSNQGSFTFRFYCQDTCSFECTLALQGNNLVYSQCNTKRYTANSLQNGKTYLFGVRVTDDVGNQGNPVTYTWKVGEQRTHGLINVIALF